jgi:hypothetical protein
MVSNPSLSSGDDHFYQFPENFLEKPRNSFPALMEISLPPLFQNHYLRRLFLSHEEVVEGEEERSLTRKALFSEVLLEMDSLLRSSCLLFPCLVDLQSSSSVFFQCPANGHLVLFSPSYQEQSVVSKETTDKKSGSSSSFTVTLLDSNQAQQLGVEIRGNLTFQEKTGTLVSSLRYQEKQKEKKSDTASATASSYSGRITSLKENEFFFAPGQFLTQITPQGGASSRSLLLVQCLFDPSNLLSLQEYLKGFSSSFSSSSLSLGHSHLSQLLFDYQLANDLLLSFEQQKFSVFEKQPKETGLSLQEYLQPNIIITSSTTSSSGPNTGSGSDTSVGSDNNRKNRKKRSGAGGADLSPGSGTGGGGASLHHLMAWKQSLYQLLLPPPGMITTPTTPSVGVAVSRVGRTQAVLTWQENTFLPTENDPSRLGYSVVVCELIGSGKGMGMVYYRPGNHSFLVEQRNWRVQLISDLNNPLNRTDQSSCIERTYFWNKKSHHNDNHELLSIRRVSFVDPSSIESGKRLSRGRNDYQHEKTIVKTIRVDGDRFEVRLALEGLNSGSSYQVKVARVYGTTGGHGPYSDWTPVFSTRPLSAPSLPLGPSPNPNPSIVASASSMNSGSSSSSAASSLPLLASDKIFVYQLENPNLFGFGKTAVLGGELYLSPPEDDGGKPVLGYGLYSRVVGTTRDSNSGSSEGENSLSQYFSPEWSYHGSFPVADNNRIDFYNLMDSLVYEFKVSFSHLLLS